MAAKKTYTESDRALYAQYVDKRATYQPDACKFHGECWVALGPPGLNMNGGFSRCFECKDAVPGRYRRGIT